MTSNTMTATYFPEDVFRLIKSYTKPKVKCVECYKVMDLTNDGGITRIDGKGRCGDCCKKYKCRGACGIRKMFFKMECCMMCDRMLCNEEECATTCVRCDLPLCSRCEDEDGNCEDCRYEENGTSDEDE